MSTLEAGMPLGSAYTLVQPLGAGAMGSVWSVSKTGNERLYAAKILDERLSQDSEFVARFVQERILLSSLRYRYIVPVHDLVVEGNTLAIVMEYEQGGSLRRYLESQGSLAPVIALGTVQRVLYALEYAHRAGVLHLDIKPDNVLISGNSAEHLVEQVRIADFGIAQWVSDSDGVSGIFDGTPVYMSPERRVRGISSPAADVYSAGVLLHELLSGVRPVTGRDGIAHVSSVIPEDIRTVIEGMLLSDPGARLSALVAGARLGALIKPYTGASPLTIELPSTSGQSSISTADNSSIHTGMSAPAATVVRSAAIAAHTVIGTIAGASPIDMGVPDNATVIRERPSAISTPSTNREEEEPEKPQSIFKTLLSAFSRPVVWGSTLGVIALVAVLVFVLFTPNQPAESVASEPLSVSARTPQVLPTGLGTHLDARYDAKEQIATLTFEFSAQKVALEGDILQVIPGVDSDSCPEVQWSGAGSLNSATPNSAVLTGFDTACAWSLNKVHVAANSSTQISARVKTSIKDQNQLQHWVQRIQEETARVLNDPQVHSTSYVLQRLRGVQVRVPSRVVNQSAVEVTLLPEWPSGVDELNPMMRLPRTGQPSSLIRVVAPSAGDIEFSDGCYGHLAVAADQSNVTTLSVASSCRVNVRVGNFVGLKSNEFAIVSR